MAQQPAKDKHNFVWPPKHGLYWDLLISMAMGKPYECQECGLLSKTPVELTCPQHIEENEEGSDDGDEGIIVFCEECLTSKIEQNGGKCPRNNHSNPSWQKSIGIAKLINQLKVRCAYKLRQTKR